MQGTGNSPATIEVTTAAIEFTNARRNTWHVAHYSKGKLRAVLTSVDEVTTEADKTGPSGVGAFQKLPAAKTTTENGCNELAPRSATERRVQDHYAPALRARAKFLEAVPKS